MTDSHATSQGDNVDFMLQIAGKTKHFGAFGLLHSAHFHYSCEVTTFRVSRRKATRGLGRRRCQSRVGVVQR